MFFNNKIFKVLKKRRIFLKGTLVILLCTSLLLTVTPFSLHPNKASAETIIFQDSFESGLGNWQLTGGPIETSTSMASDGTRSVSVGYNSSSNWRFASHLFSQPLSSARVMIKIYDDLTLPSGDYAFLSLSDANYTKGLSIGIKPAVSSSNYVYCPTERLEGCMDSGIPRTKGWHELKIFVTPKGSYGKIDKKTLTTLPANQINHPVNTSFTQFQRINFGVQGTSGSGKVYFDFAYIPNIPPAPSDPEIARIAIKTFIDTYPLDLNTVGQLIEKRKADKKWYPNSTHIYITLLNISNIYTADYLITGQTSSLAKAIETIRYVVERKNDWYGDNFLMSLVTYYIVRNSWPIWQNLPLDLQAKIRDLGREAGNFLLTQNPLSDYINDSKGEENNWKAIALDALSSAFSDMPESSLWFEKARIFAFHSLSRYETFGGITTRTIYDDYLFDNHNLHPNPSYALGVVASLANITYRNQKMKGYSPEEYKQNAFEVWKKMKEYIDFRNFYFKGWKISGPDVIKTGRDDWNDDALAPIVYRFIKEVFGDNSVSDPETGFSTSDLARHAMEYFYYTRLVSDPFVWIYDPPGTLLDPNEDIPYGNEVGLNRVSYRWMRNAHFTTAFPGYIIFFYRDLNSLFKPEYLKGDLNGDNKINLADYDILVSNLGKTGSPNFILSDLVEDGRVDIFDLNKLLGNWLQLPSSTSVTSTPTPTPSPAPTTVSGCGIYSRSDCGIKDTCCKWSTSMNRCIKIEGCSN